MLKSKISTQWLRSFYALADHGSMTLTAQALGMSQSSISYHISELETEIGMELVQRYKGGVCLTDDGKILFEQVSRFIKIANSSNALGDDAPRVLNMCVLHDSLVDFVICNNKRSNKLNIEFHPMIADKDIFEALETNQFDVVITPYLRTAQDLRKVQICKASYYLIASKNIDINTLSLNAIAKKYPYIKYHCRKPFQREIASMLKVAPACISVTADKYQALMLCEESVGWTIFAIPEGLEHFNQQVDRCVHIKKLDMETVDYYMFCQSYVEQHIYDDVCQLALECYGS